MGSKLAFGRTIDMRWAIWKLSFQISSIQSFINEGLQQKCGHHNDGRWSIIFKRQINDWELQRVADSYSSLEQFTGLQTGEDVLWWQGNNRGLFKVNATYRMTNHSNQQIDNQPWKHTWKTKIPQQVACFMRYQLKKQPVSLHQAI